LRHKADRYLYTSHFFLRILLLIICVALAAIIIAYSKDIQAQTTSDWAFLNIMGLPWRCGDEDPRHITRDWNDHWEDYPNGGASIDFNATGRRDRDRDVLAPFGGRVTTGYSKEDYGNFVIIDAGNGWSVRLAVYTEALEGKRFKIDDV
jgi:hypothetical protein